MPSVYQLLPTTAYSQADPNWLKFDPKQTGISRVPQPDPIGALQFSDTTNTALLYTDLYTGLADDPEFQALSDQLVGLALRFEVSLQTASGKAYFHPNTTVVFTDDMKTLTRGEVIFEGQVARDGKTVVESLAKGTKEKAGDETVPTISASPDRTEPPPVLRKKFSGVSHQNIPATDSVVNFLIDEIAAAP
jgi:hypothetical protein